MKTQTFRFPGAVNTVHQTGQAVTDPRDGVNVKLHTAEGAETPHSAEVYSDDAKEYADMGLEWEGRTLTGYDGAFDIPREIITALEFLGFKISDDLRDEDTMNELESRRVDSKQLARFVDMIAAAMATTTSAAGSPADHAEVQLRAMIAERARMKEFARSIFGAFVRVAPVEELRSEAFKAMHATAKTLFTIA